MQNTKASEEQNISSVKHDTDMMSHMFLSINSHDFMFVVRFIAKYEKEFVLVTDRLQGGTSWSPEEVTESSSLKLLLLRPDWIKDCWWPIRSETAAPHSDCKADSWSQEQAGFSDQILTSSHNVVRFHPCFLKRFTVGAIAIWSTKLPGTIVTCCAHWAALEL